MNDELFKELADLRDNVIKNELCNEITKQGLYHKVSEEIRKEKNMPCKTCKMAGKDGKSIASVTCEVCINSTFQLYTGLISISEYINYKQKAYPLYTKKEVDK